MQTEGDRCEGAVLSRESVLNDVKQIVGEVLSVAPGSVAENADLENDLGADSLDLVEIAMEVEEHFDIAVPDELQGKTRTAGEIADGVLQFRPAAPPATGSAV